MSNISQSAAELLHKHEMVRIHELWKECKLELKKKNQQLAEFQRRQDELIAERDRQSRREREALETALLEARDKTRFAELQLAAARADKAKASNALEESNRRLEQFEEAMSREVDVARTQTSQMREMSERLRLAEEQLSLREQENEMLRSRTTGHDDDVRYLRQQLAEANKRASSLQSKLDNSEIVNQELSRLFDESKGSVHQASQIRAQLKVQHYEAEKLRINQARLLRLLANSHEYRQFFEEVGDGDGVVYVPPLGAKLPGGSNSNGDASSSNADGLRQLYEELRSLTASESSSQVLENDRSIEPNRETDYWIPSECRLILNDFKHRYCPHLPVGLFSQLLVDLNIIWRKREKQRVARSKKQVEEKMVSLTKKKSGPSGASRDAQQLLSKIDGIDQDDVDFIKTELKRLIRRLQSQPRSAARPLASTAEEKLFELIINTLDKLMRLVTIFQNEADILHDRLDDIVRSGNHVSEDNDEDGRYTYQQPPSASVSRLSMSASKQRPNSARTVSPTKRSPEKPPQQSRAPWRPSSATLRSADLSVSSSSNQVNSSVAPRVRSSSNDAWPSSSSRGIF